MHMYAIHGRMRVCTRGRATCQSVGERRTRTFDGVGVKLTIIIRLSHVGPSRAKKGLDLCPGQGEALCLSIDRSFLSFLDSTCFFGAACLLSGISTLHRNRFEGKLIVKICVSIDSIESRLKRPRVPPNNLTFSNFLSFVFNYANPNESFSWSKE